ncbi:helix-turn-helix domain-containing protein [Vibrio lentus]|uniref:helix-turn-helix domain-containing protein n=1 Tax=Vibrio TaxID=662 RepID=UPI000C85338C|nr:helix-turn-helix domain-containing protein [Vibrio lentus]PMG17826.1 hypothetical protein BCU98_00405 [Vibrio splendidus]
MSTKAQLYKRYLVAYSIHCGIDSVPKLRRELEMPYRTIQNIIDSLEGLDIKVEFIGAKKTGRYVILDWGPYKLSWMKKEAPYMRQVLSIQKSSDDL